MFNFHTSLLTANEEIDRLTAKNAKLTERNDELEAHVVTIDSLSHEIEYLKNKLICASQIETSLREKLSENELKIKAYRDSAKIVKNYHEEHTTNAKVGIGFDYENEKKRKNNKGKEKKTFENPNVPGILKKVDNPIFKETDVEFDEELMVIKQQLLEEEKSTSGNILL